MKNTLPLRQNHEFSRVYRKGRFISDQHVVLHYLKRGGGKVRLGVTASSKIRKSVQRNRIKRLLRESYRTVEKQIKPGYDLILVGRNTATQPDLHQIQPEVVRLLRRAGLLNETDLAADTKVLRQEGEEGE
ncbi:MAG: ribonuclease P protein component [Clostridia bacterium]|nr:ribonuclease P protein component [Clostridia bacterium]